MDLSTAFQKWGEIPEARTYTACQELRPCPDLLGVGVLRRQPLDALSKWLAVGASGARGPRDM